MPKIRVLVKEGEAGAVLRPGLAWIAPGDHHMLLRRALDGVQLVLPQDAPENSCRPAVDPLFRSAAQLYGAHTLGLVLTGMGHHGLRGAELIRQARGLVLTQNEATSVVWGMPGAVTSAGLADRIVPHDQIASELVVQARVGRPLPVFQPLTR